MFTGIIEEVGTVKAFDRNSSGARLVISAGQVLADLSVGGSISVNGVCLTAIDITDTSFTLPIDLEPGITYQWTIRAGNTKGWGKPFPFRQYTT